MAAGKTKEQARAILRDWRSNGQTKLDDYHSKKRGELIGGLFVNTADLPGTIRE
jgi:hypothetical protein